MSRVGSLCIDVIGKIAGKKGSQNISHCPLQIVLPHMMGRCVLCLMEYR